MRFTALPLLFTPRFVAAIACAALTFLNISSATAQPSDARVREILAQRIDVDKQAVGIAVALTDGTNMRFVTHGHTSLNKNEAITADTLFDVGSITKTFTTLLLADMVIKGEVKLDDPVERWLPQGMLGLKLRDHTGAPIRLLDLATHRSGLPRMPNNMVNGTPHDPYVDYREQQLLLFLKEREVMVESDGGKTTKKRDEAYAYSNLGLGLLGYTLARAANTTYSNLLQTRVLTPLGLTSTFLTVPRSETGRYSAGHYLDKGVTLRGARHWRFDVIAPAGALAMSAKDIARYGQAASGAIDTPLREAFELTQKRYGDGISPMNPTGLAWILAPLNGRTVVNHDGMTGGFAASLWVDPERKSSVAVLGNASVAVLDIGLHLMEPSIPLKNLAAMRATAVAVDAKTMAQYVGTYALTQTFSVTIRLRDGKLFAQATGQGEFEIFGKNNTTFFARITPLEIVFEDVKDGKAASFSLTQGGNTRKATRVD